MIERRKFTRIGYSNQIECSHYTKPCDGSVVVLKNNRMVMLNLSVGGIGIVTDTKLEKNGLLSFTFCLNKVSHTIESIVKWSDIKGEMYQYGIEFINMETGLLKKLQVIIDEEEPLLIGSTN